jgi:hypothetical protein
MLGEFLGFRGGGTFSLGGWGGGLGKGKNYDLNYVDCRPIVIIEGN